MTVNSFLENVQGVSNIPQGAVDALGRLAGKSFWAQLKPASFRKIPFFVQSGNARFGRRNATHEYPFRDTPWVEDLGRSVRRINVTGFLVGDDVIAQREKLIAACEQPGSAKGGELVHPTLGVLQVALMDFSTTEHYQQGRVFEIQFSFIEQGQRLFPSSAASAPAAATADAAAMDESSIQAFTKRAVAALQQGAAVANAAAREASAFAAQAIQIGTDATSLFNMAVSLPGEFGRLLGQLKGITLGQVLPSAAGASLQSLIGAAASHRVAISSAAADLNTAGTALGPATTSAFATASQSLAEAVRAAAPTPGDAVRAMLALIAYPPVVDGYGAALTAQQSAGDTFRRAAVAATARSAAEYQPASVDDAVAVRSVVLGAIDAEVTQAGDQGEDGVYTSLRSIRAGTVRALNAAGAGLPTLVTITIPLPQPSLVLAQRLYRDLTRADELVTRANPRHPAFMPTRFQALSA